MPDQAAMTRAEAAAALGLAPHTITNMVGTRRLRSVGWGLVDRAQVEQLAESRAELRRQREERRPTPRLVPDGDLIDSAEAARILGCTPQNVSRLAATDRLPYTDAGPAGTGRRRFYRRGQLEVIARARGVQHVPDAHDLEAGPP